MKTLVIHPDDRSTDFLKPIYAGIECTVITSKPKDSELRNLIRTHDRVMMMGHGDNNGLWNVVDGMMCDYFIDKTHAPLLKQKKENFYIWCLANMFVERYKLPGFYTGMFISEVSEAKMLGIKVTQEEVDYSNNLFAENLGRIVNNGPSLLNEIKSVYSHENCPVISYNNFRLKYA